MKKYINEFGTEVIDYTDERIIYPPPVYTPYLHVVDDKNYRTVVATLNNIRKRKEQE